MTRLGAGLLMLALAGPLQAGNLGGLLQGIVQQASGGAASSKQNTADNGDSLSNLASSLKSGDISEADERKIGTQIAGNLLGVAPLVKDDRLQRYVNRVGRWVALQSERPDIEWRFGVVDSEDLNAFAAPGGYVLLTKGLYRQLHNEAELAGVIGHEIGHVIKKHHLELLRKSQQVSGMGGILGMVAQHKLGKENALVRQGVQNLIGNGAEIVARGLDKDAEFEADRIGLVLSARAGYDAYALPAVLQEIGHVPAKDNRVALLFKTHPHPDDRFEKLANAVGDRLDGLEPGKMLEERFYRLGSK